MSLQYVPCDRFYLFTGVEDLCAVKRGHSLCTGKVGRFFFSLILVFSVIKEILAIFFEVVLSFSYILHPEVPTLLVISECNIVARLLLMW